MSRSIQPRAELLALLAYTSCLQASIALHRGTGGDEYERVKTLLLGRLLSVIAIGLMVGEIRPHKRASAALPETVPGVEVARVQQQDVSIVHEWIGTFDGLVNADVRAQVTGYLLKQGYQEVAFVKKGQLLFQIDPRPFQAALDQAEGQLAQAKAQLTPKPYKAAPNLMSSGTLL